MLFLPHSGSFQDAFRFPSLSPHPHHSRSLPFPHSHLTSTASWPSSSLSQALNIPSHSVRSSPAKPFPPSPLSLTTPGHSRIPTIVRPSPLPSYECIRRLSLRHHSFTHFSRRHLAPGVALLGGDLRTCFLQETNVNSLQSRVLRAARKFMSKQSG